MSATALRVRIRGQVQGVGYRAWVARQARALGLTGWVRNLTDGTVETALFGEAERVEDMVRRCWTGPSAARVEGVETMAEPGSPPRGFEQRPTL